MMNSIENDIFFKSRSTARTVYQATWHLLNVSFDKVSLGV